MKDKNKINIALALCYLVCVLAMIWPGAMIANRIEPMIFGFPFMFAWYIAWIFILFLGFLIAYLAENKRAEK